MKIAICTPCYRHTEALYTLSLAGMIAHSVKQLPNDEIFTAIGQGVLPEIRNMIARDALAAGAEWLLWIDADQTFPQDTLTRLLGRGQAIVGCNIPMRRIPHDPSAGKLVGPNKTEPTRTTKETAEANKLELVDVLGLGLCLTHASVFKAVGEPYFEGANEDYWFFEKARRAGFEVWLDHGVSGGVGHIIETVLTNYPPG